MTQYTTRRALREAERRGITPEVAQAPVVAAPEPTSPIEQPAAPAIDVSKLTRRQMKELGIFDNPDSVLTRSAPVSNAPAAVTTAAAPVLTPPISPAPVAIPIPEFEIPKADFNEQNYLAEPTTASIVLERAPEAIVLPMDTGEIAITNSIQVVTDPITSPTTGNFDGSELDQIILSDDSVTGVISVVEPISALDLIDQRASSGVVPTSVLSKGWWKPWAIGIGAILLTVAAVLSIVLMLNAVGSN